MTDLDARPVTSSASASSMPQGADEDPRMPRLGRSAGFADFIAGQWGESERPVPVVEGAAAVEGDRDLAAGAKSGVGSAVRVGTDGGEIEVAAGPLRVAGQDDLVVGQERDGCRPVLMVAA